MPLGHKKEVKNSKSHEILAKWVVLMKDREYMNLEGGASGINSSFSEVPPLIARRLPKRGTGKQ